MTDTLLDWKPVPAPPRAPIDGRYVDLQPLDVARHGDDLWHALQGPESDPALWDYLPYGPFAERSAFDSWLRDKQSGSDPLFFTVVDKATERAVGCSASCVSPRPMAASRSAISPSAAPCSALQPPPKRSGC